jgi:hypothetical protein
VVAAAGLGYLLVRHDGRRPLLGGILGAVVLVGNLASGRITFAVGLALGLLALCAVAAPRPARPVRLLLAALLAALATWASPVAGLFTGVAGGALLLARLRPSEGLGRRVPGGRRVVPPLGEALALCLAPAAALAPMAVLFGNGGTQPFTAESMRINVGLAVAAFFVLPRRPRALRIGAVLTVLLLVGAYYLPSPIGSNALRLPMLFVLPLLAAYAPLPGPWLAALLAAALWWQSPVMVSDLTRAGSPESRVAFFRPLVDELARRGPLGRVEVVPLRDHWEAAYVPPTVPLARGWERQVDVARNPLFYRTALDAGEYADWLRRNAVSYVALARDSPPDRYAQQEAALVSAGPPYLREVWRGGGWTLYGVTDRASIVEGGTLAAASAGDLTLYTPSAGDVLVRVRWSRWLTVSGPDACLVEAAGDWTTVRAAAAGRYRVSSGLRPGPFCAAAA